VTDPRAHPPGLFLD